MAWNRRRNVLLNGVVGAVLGYAIARLRGRDDTRRIALLVGTTFAVINWLTYDEDALLAQIFVESVQED